MLIIGIVLMIALLAGCGEEKEAEEAPEKMEFGSKSIAGKDVMAKPVKEKVEAPVEEAEPKMPEIEPEPQAEEEPTQELKEASELDVSLEELEQLNKELEELEFEDLGGLE